MKSKVAFAVLVAFGFYVLNTLRANRNAALENLVASERESGRDPEVLPPPSSGPLNQFSNLPTLTVAIEGGRSLASLQNAANQKEYGKVTTDDLKPVYLHNQIQHEGQTKNGIIAYADPGAPLGTTMTTETKKLLTLLLQDPEMEVLDVVHPQQDSKRNATYTRDQIQTVVGLLR